MLIKTIAVSLGYMWPYLKNKLKELKHMTSRIIHTKYSLLLPARQPMNDSRINCFHDNIIFNCQKQE